MKRKVIIMGAAGRDFHNFLVFFKDNPAYEVVAFTASQLPGIEKRTFPKELAGRLYRNDIPIYPEEMLPELIKKFSIDLAVLAYSDLKDTDVMHKASLANSCGADFMLMGTETMLKSKKPVIAITAVRTGCGKSPTARRVAGILKKNGFRVVLVRHPMPYGDLKEQEVQRFETIKDLKKQKCTVEELEDYLPHIEMGNIVYAGVNYEKILRRAEKEADVIIWDGGNNDMPFYRPDLWIVITDPLRPGHEVTYYPGEINLRMADIEIINKEGSASQRSIEIVRNNIKKFNPKAMIIDANSVVKAKKPIAAGKKALVIEDGPTLTHGGMKFGAGMIVAKKHRVKIISPERYAVGTIKEIFRKYKHIKNLLPAMGYSSEQLADLEQTINKVPCDLVICATPIDLRKFLKVNKPLVTVSYELREISGNKLEKAIHEFLKRQKLL